MKNFVVYRFNIKVFAPHNCVFQSFLFYQWDIIISEYFFIKFSDTTHYLIKRYFIKFQANSPGKIPEVEVKILNVNSNDNNHKVLPKPVEFQKKYVFLQIYNSKKAFIQKNFKFQFN